MHNGNARDNLVQQCLHIEAAKTIFVSMHGAFTCDGISLYAVVSY